MFLGSHCSHGFRDLPWIPIAWPFRVAGGVGAGASASQGGQPLNFPTKTWFLGMFNVPRVFNEYPVNFLVGTRTTRTPQGGAGLGLRVSHLFPPFAGERRKQVFRGLKKAPQAQNCSLSSESPRVHILISMFQTYVIICNYIKCMNL